MTSLTRPSCLVLLLALTQDPNPPRSAPTAENPDPNPRRAPAVAELVVRPVRVIARPTRRASCTFEFEVVRVDSDAGKLLGDRVRAGTLRFGCYQGADRQDGKDAEQRLDWLIGRGTPEEATEQARVRGLARLFPEDAGELRLWIILPSDPVQELWLLRDARDRRITLAPGTNN
jgi:hypothetical protein